MSETKATPKTTSSKKIWISVPVSTPDVNDPKALAFLADGMRKQLEVETAAFVEKFLLDHSVPFSVDFDHAKVEKEAVLSSLPRRLRRELGVKEVKSSKNEEYTSDNDPFLGSLPL